MSADRLTAGNVPTVNGLSELQGDILRFLLSNYQHVETNGNDYYRSEIAYWGVGWRPFGVDGEPNGSERAAMSRALRRLEARGLVERRNCHTGDRYQEHDDRPPVTRTLSVKFTDEGRRLAERLTKDVTDIVNREADES